MQRISQSCVLENIDLKDTLCTPDFEEDTIKTPSHKLSFALWNNNKTFMLSQSKSQVQESTTSKGASAPEFHERPSSVGV